MRIILILFFLSCCNLNFGQTLNNWHKGKTDLSVNPIYILKDTFLYNDTKYNYKRVYKDKRFIEYGNVDANHKANGQWVILNRYTPVLKGVAENGYKIDKWLVENCAAEGSFYVYKWTDDRSKTYMDTGFYKVPAKVFKPSGKKPKKLIAK